MSVPLYSVQVKIREGSPEGIRVTMDYDSALQYDREFDVDLKAGCVQLNLAHLARKKYKTEETKTNKRHCPISSVQVKIRH